MKFSPIAVSAAVVATALGSTMALGCAARTTTGQATSTTAAATATATVSLFTAQWMNLAIPEEWKETDRTITAEFQKFGLRPVDETELPRNCNGCGAEPPTAILTAYAPGVFDPTEARAGEQVTVTDNSEGFFRSARDSGEAAALDPVLAWEYTDDAWATVRGRTSTTSELPRMLNLARALRPLDRTAIRVPLSIPNLPPGMPLAQITSDSGEYGTRLIFAQCGDSDVGGSRPCAGEADSLRVQIWPGDGYSGQVREKDAVPVRIGGRDGSYDADALRAAVQVAPGMLVVFELGGPYGRPGEPETPPEADLRDILAGVVWASDPGDSQTWPAVADWAKPI